MTPKTKTQIRLTKLHKQLPDLTDVQRRWAQTTCVQSIARLCKVKMWCSDCGNSFEDPKITSQKKLPKNAKVVCPHCHKQLLIEKSRKQKAHQSVYFSIIDRIEDVQVIRHFVIEKSSRKRHECYISIREAVQNLITPNGKFENFARSAQMSIVFDRWIFTSNMELRGEPNVDAKYNINPLFIYPKMHIIPQLRRNGFKRSFHNIAPRTLFCALLADPKAETILKARQTKLLQKYVREPHTYAAYWKQIKICIRHRYTINDPITWRDYIRMIDRLSKDIHNPQFVCPIKLKEAHDRADKQLRKIDRQRKDAEARNKALEDEQNFLQSKSKFFGILITDGEITVEPLRSIQEFIAEADTMKHCVFSGRYYTKAESLILSAKKDGLPIETIELSLKDFDIIQSRGQLNKNTEYHDRIVELVRSNIDLIRKVERAS